MPIEYPVIVCPIIVLIVLRLRRIVASQLGKHRQSRFSYASTAIAARANANAGIIRIGHDEPFRPSMELRAQLRGRRRYVRYRTHQPTPVSAGATLVHHACARLQRGDVLTTGRKNPLALRTHRAVERILRRSPSMSGMRLLSATSNCAHRSSEAPVFSQRPAPSPPTGSPTARRPVRQPAHQSARQHCSSPNPPATQTNATSAGSHRSTRTPWQELVAFRRLERRIPSVADHRIFKNRGHARPQKIHPATAHRSNADWSCRFRRNRHPQLPQYRPGCSAQPLWKRY